MKTIIIICIIIVTSAGCVRHDEPEHIDSALHGPDLVWTNPIWQIVLQETNAPKNETCIIIESVTPMGCEIMEKNDVSRMGLIYDVPK